MRNEKRARLQRWYRNVGWTTVAAVLFLILVGGIVRSTGAGMGCPDWPKCFGSFVPPTSADEVSWESGKSFAQGQMIIHEEKLLVAQESFTASGSFTASNWEVYEKHDYAVFNMAHTWTEYINRLVGVIIGILTFATALLSFSYYSQNKWIPALSTGAWILTGVEGWLGAKVVDTNLAGWMVTIHMLLAMVILMMIAGAVLSAKSNKEKLHNKPDVPAWLPWLASLTLVLTLVQVLLGTQVRESVDAVAESMGFENRGEWLAGTGKWFSFHKVFYFSIVAAAAGLAYEVFRRFSSTSLEYRTTLVFLACIALEIIFGMFLSYADLPAWLQPLHLLFAGAIVLLCFILNFRLFGVQEKDKKSVFAGKVSTELK